jgi:hypothetical protein
MLKPKQLFIIIYVNVCVKRVYPHKTNNNILFRYGKIPESQFSVRPTTEFAMIELRNNRTVFEELEVSIVDLTVTNVVLLATRSCVTSSFFSRIF